MTIPLMPILLTSASGPQMVNLVSHQGRDWPSLLQREVVLESVSFLLGIYKSSLIRDFLMGDS